MGDGYGEAARYFANENNDFICVLLAHESWCAVDKKKARKKLSITIDSATP